MDGPQGLPSETEPKSNDRDIQRLVRLVGLSAEDSAHIAMVRDVVLNDAAGLTAGFIDSLRRLDDTANLFKNDDALVAEATRLKRDHLVAMLSGEYGPEYGEQCARLGTFYSKAGFDVAVFLGALRELIQSIGTVITRDSAIKPEDVFAAVTAMQKLAFLEIGIIVDAWISERERVINQLQQEVIRELSTPVLQVRERVLILPLIGTIDSQRAVQITDSLLHAIRANRARVVVIDITGVAAVDSKVANHLLQTVAASQLMGTRVIVTGLSAEVAQSLVGLGIDLSKVNTIGDLQGGLEESDRILGYRTVRMSEAPYGVDRPREE
jgi:rsbT co-antagonist protein RsbR